MRDDRDTFDALIAEAVKQARKAGPPACLSRRDKLLWRLGWLDGWFLLKGEIARRRPFRWAWQARCAWLLYRHCNAPPGDFRRATFRQDWDYAAGLAEMMDDAGEGYLSPMEAISEDRTYWEE